MEAIILVVLCIIALRMGMKAYGRRRRRARLLEKYGDAAVVARIMSGTVWQGMSRDQLIDSWGKPAGIGQKAYKTKLVETCKYNRIGKNRFASRVTVENGVVTGWERK